jgi:hypothetical protein
MGGHSLEMNTVMVVAVDVVLWDCLQNYQDRMGGPVRRLNPIVATPLINKDDLN